MTERIFLSRDKLDPMFVQVNLREMAGPSAAGLLVVPLFTIDKLSDSARAKVIEVNRYNLAQFDGWDEFILDRWKEKLAALGFEDVEILYSGFASQGDGASFTTREIDISKYIRATHQDKEHFPRLLVQLEANLIDNECAVTRVNFHHNHENSVIAVVEFLPGADDPCSEEMANLELEMADRVKSLCKKMYRELEQEHDGLVADASVLEELRQTEVLFTAAGEQVIKTGTMED